MDFGDAIKSMKEEGQRVTRKGWDEAFVVYMTPMSLPAYNTQGTERKVNDRTAKWIGENTPLETLGYFAMFTSDKKWMPGWTPNQMDILADDWLII